MGYPAFSGLGKDIKDLKATDAGAEPITIGRYTIVDRPIGGRFLMMGSMIHDLIRDSPHNEWFALYSTSFQRRQDDRSEDQARQPAPAFGQQDWHSARAASP